MANNKTNNKPPRKANKNSQWRNIRDKEKLLVAKDILMFIRATLLARVKTSYIKGPSKSPLSYSSQDVGLIWDWLDRNRPLENLLEEGEEDDSNSTIDTPIDNSAPNDSVDSSSKDNEHVDANGIEPCDEEHKADNNLDIAEKDKE